MTYIEQNKNLRRGRFYDDIKMILERTPSGIDNHIMYTLGYGDLEYFANCIANELFPNSGAENSLEYYKRYTVCNSGNIDYIKGYLKKLDHDKFLEYIHDDDEIIIVVSVTCEINQINVKEKVLNIVKDCRSKDCYSIENFIDAIKNELYELYKVKKEIIDEAVKVTPIHDFISQINEELKDYGTEEKPFSEEELIELQGDYYGVETVMSDLINKFFISCYLNIRYELYNRLIESVLSAEYFIFDQDGHEDGNNSDIEKENILNALINVLKNNAIAPSDKGNILYSELKNRSYDLSIIEQSLNYYNILFQSLNVYVDKEYRQLALCDLNDLNVAEIRFYETISRCQVTNHIDTEQLSKCLHIIGYIFMRLIDMSLIDLNYIIGQDEFKSLIKFNKELKIAIETLEKYIPKANDNKEAECNGITNHFISADIFGKTINLLKKAKIKTRFLIYKSAQSDKNNVLKSYTYLVEGNIEKYQVLDDVQPIHDYVMRNVECELKSRNSNKDYIVYRHRDVTKSDYELLLHRIKEQDLGVDNINSICRVVDDEYKRGSNENYNVTRYNNIIAENTKIHYVDPSSMVIKVKWLRRKKGGILNQEHLADVENYIDRNFERRPIFCFAFIIEHIKWAKECIDKITDEIKYDDTSNLKYGNDYIIFAEKMMMQYEKFIEYLKSRTYCQKFISRYEDAFYNIEVIDSEMKSYIYHNTFDYENGELKCRNTQSVIDLNSVFIASTWHRPIGFIDVKERYQMTRMDLAYSKEKFNNKYIKASSKATINDMRVELDKSEDRMKNEVQASSRSSVQTIGIFAALISIVTASVNAFGQPQMGYVAILKAIFCVTLCLAIFIVLLRKRSNTWLVFIIIIMLTFLVFSI